MNWETQKDYIKYKIQFWLTIFIILFLVSISLSAQVSEPPTILSYGMVRCKFRFFSSERPTLERPTSEGPTLERPASEIPTSERPKT